MKYPPARPGSPILPGCFALTLALSLLPSCSPNPSNPTTKNKERIAPAYSVDPAPPLATTPPIQSQPKDRFEDVTPNTGITFVHQHCDTKISNILQSNGSGVAILDYNLDGLMDIYFVNAGPQENVTHHEPGTPRQPNQLYENLGNGTFKNVTQKAGVAGHGYGTAAIASDFDNDGDPDLYVVNFGTNILYQNQGNGTFKDITRTAGVEDPLNGIGACFADYDNDGYLDLFVANYLTFDPDYKLYFNPDAYPGPLSYKPQLNSLFRNRGNGTFENVSTTTGIQIAGHRGMSVTPFDFDADYDTDFYLCNDATPNLLLVNDGHGHFTEEAGLRGVAFNAQGEAAGSMTAAIGDYNQDLLPDILVSRLGYGSLYTSTPNKVFEDRMLASKLGQFTAQYVGWGSNFIDYDNDGDLDAFVANGDAHHLVGWESLLLRNEGDNTFTDAVEDGGTFFRQKIRARASVQLDYNNDGQQDVLVTAMGDRPFLLKNQSKPNDNHWITLQLKGTTSNRDGFGAWVTITTSSGSQRAEHRCPTAFLGSSDPRLHFGIGPASEVSKLHIRWPSGKEQTLTEIPADQILPVQEP
ncbi:MAG: hypothetical protein RI897_458 [Verrucomicrobiota bacterium]|jgi:hypothetical protein